MDTNVNWFFKTVRGQRGQGIVEYALILVMVAIILVLTLSAMGSATFQWQDLIATSVEAAGGG